MALGLSGAVAAIAVPVVARPDFKQAAYAEAPAVSTQDASSEAALVAAEDRRLIEVQTLSSLSRWQGQRQQEPYRLGTNGGYTLVLTARSAPYTVKDLLQLAPQTFLRLTDGSYVLGENVIVMAGATLNLSQPGGLTLRLASSPRSFATIVSLGGTLSLAGEANAPLKVTSWDVGAGQPDLVLADGRAYIRAVGGRFSADWVDFSNLGFWSGRTGGVALTGTDRPFTGTLQSDEESAPGAIKGGHDKASISPAGPLPAGQSSPLATYELPSLNYVSSSISNSTISGDAYGLFVSDADSIQVANTQIRDSLSDGVVLHRFVSNGLIEGTTSTHNGGDGFQLDRATQAITITQSASTLNAGNGYMISGRPLADGPSASGVSTDSYGNNAVNNSTAKDNGRYGFDVVGGFNIAIQSNQVSDNDMGIVVRQSARHVTISSNEVDQSRRHAIALTDGVTDSLVTGNIVRNASTGVYLRASVATVKGNTVESVSGHGISLVGPVAGASVSYNVISGRGTSAIDGARADGHTTRDGNKLVAWHNTSAWTTQLKRWVHPSTGLWGAIVLLLLLSAVRSREKHLPVAHPYAQQQVPGVDPSSPHQIDVRDRTYTGVD